MMNKSVQTKQPLSLKWKWSLLLWGAFALISALGLYSYFSMSQATQLSLQVQQAQQFVDRTMHYLDHVQQPLTKETFVQENHVLKFFEDDEVTFRVFNEKHQFIYETRAVTLPNQPYTSTISTVRLNHDIAFVATISLMSAANNDPINQIEVIKTPKLFNEMRRQQFSVMLLTILVVWVLSAIIAFALTRYQLRPLNYLNNVLDSVEEESLAQIRVRKPRTMDEWSDLGEHINRLLDKIDLYVRNQKQFVEDVSHELRTPVAIVEGHLKMLNRWGKDDPEVLAESISASLQEMTRMKGLVQEMLDLSRADHANIDYKDEITEVYSTVQQVYNNFVMLYPNFHFHLDSERSGKELYIQMYRSHFEQVLIILLDNAVKYSKDRHEIHLSVSPNFTKVEIAVQDFGEGMTEEDKTRVFGRFYRVDKARSREKGGNGLGLSIAKQLVEIYKGMIRVESVLNHGSIFYIEFPVIVDHAEIAKYQQIALKKSL
ncbi:MAG: HAMP domain-containing sensor histidine kinase [Aerococcaceae bacterium]|nr:HAMP domain-containing sensor histidine kinase [Aerococcaceae bacterium]